MRELFSDKQDFIRQYRQSCESTFGRPFEACHSRERYEALVELIVSKAQNVAAENVRTGANEGKKRVYYFSLEFLIGPLLENYLINFGCHDLVQDGLEDMGTSLAHLCEQAVDPGLGNGGLGRLAACFLDSMAHEGIVGYGMGMRYRYGFFRQEIVDGKQVEVADNWLEHGYPWEVRRSNEAVEVRFGGEVVRHEDEGGRYWFTWEGGDVVRAVPYDVPVVGYGGETVNQLRLWSAEPATQAFDLDAFNAGHYARATKYRTDVEAISAILYPNDSGEHGRLLRLKQEYLFVTAGLQSIIANYKRVYGNRAWTQFPDRVAIHTNDTHPAMCGPELMRLLVDEEGLTWDMAWDVTTRTLSYTNHPVLPEALETWPINTFRDLLPRTYMYIDEINRRYMESMREQGGDWQASMARKAILWDGVVRMANLSIVCSHSVNGVSELHTSILEHDVLKDFYDETPEKFNNKTNGICHRRFLAEANPYLSRLVISRIGEGWLDDAAELSQLARFADDGAFLDEMAEAKLRAKRRLATYVKRTCGMAIDPNSVFDVQVKRFHAYKRQLLNVFKVLDVYNRILADPTYDPRPTTFIFSGKAAQSYYFAKEVIRLINAVADVVNNDPRASSIIRVCFVPNFAVGNAQLIYPAAEISEQISTAGQEASGTSNMKLMMNGAVTLGTYDGSNVEISRLAGEENIKIFGMRVEQIDELRASGGYWAWDAYNADRERLGRVVDELTDGTLSRQSGDFQSVRDALMNENDQNFVLADFHDYVRAWEELVGTYGDSRAWNRMSLMNVASSGYFSSDRTIREYAEDIWGIR